MLTRTTIAAAGLAATLAGTGAAQAASCEAFRIGADGREIRLSAAETARLRADYGISASGSSTRISSRSSSAGSGYSSSSAYASSSSRGGGSASAVSSVIGADGRRVTIIHDRLGCRIVVDDR